MEDDVLVRLECLKQAAANTFNTEEQMRVAQQMFEWVYHLSPAERRVFSEDHPRPS